MQRFSLAAMVCFVVVSTATAHFVFVVPSADGTKAQVILSDSLKPDGDVDIDKIAATKLFIRRADSADTPAAMSKVEHAFTILAPGSGTRIVFGSTLYGVMQRGEDKPFLLQYYPKSIIGEFVGSKPLGDVVPVEIVTIGTAGKLRFQVLARGKSLADTEVTVMLPGKDESKRVTTDSEGRTPAFAQTGRYGVWARFVENKSGEHGGKKYEECRHYATLVVDVGTSKVAN